MQEQEQDKEFKIGQKVRYLGGDPDAFIKDNIEGIIEDDALYWGDSMYVYFEEVLSNGNLMTYNQIVLKSCLEIIE